MAQFSPNALCFGDEFPAAGAPCLVQVEEHGLTVTFTSDTATGEPESVPFSSLTVSAGGLDHDQLVVKWAGQKGERTLYLKSRRLQRPAPRQGVPRSMKL